MPNGWRTINSLVHKIRLHGRRGKGMAESFSRQKSRHAPQKEGGLKILCDLPPVWPRLVRPTNLMSRMDGKKTHTHTTHSHFTTNQLRLLSTCPLHTNSGCGEREAHINWSMVTCQGSTRTGTTLRTTGPVPADSRQWTPSVRNCVIR